MGVQPGMTMKPLLTALLASFAVAAAGCGGGGAREAVGGSGTCAFVASFHGHRYFGLLVHVAPAAGRRLGTAQMPPCDDTGGALPAAPGERLRVAELPGVPSSVALVVLGFDDTLLVRDTRHPDHLPNEVTRLLHPPACAAGDSPLTLEGPWTGILGADGKTEVDLVPPYDLSLRVQRSSAQRYLRATLDVRVPAELGRPLTRSDVRTSLWKGGTISLTVACRDGRYIATNVTAAPPD
jgi:Family of unknown function (DUF6281)